MKDELITVGKRVAYAGRKFKGKGVVKAVDKTGKRGAFYLIEDEKHPKGGLWARAAQISSDR